MRIQLPALCVLCLCVTVTTIGCDTPSGFSSLTPTAPTALSVAAGPRPIRALGIECAIVLDGYQCTANAMYIDGTEGPVTGVATWTADDPAVATVDRNGLVTAHRAGEVSISAEFRGSVATLSITVQPGALRRLMLALSGFVTDEQDGTRIPGVTVEVIDGPNVGRTTGTGGNGEYRVLDLETGAFTVRFTKAGYVTLDESFVLKGTELQNLNVSLARYRR